MKLAKIDMKTQRRESGWLQRLVRRIISKSQQELNQQHQQAYSNTEDDYPYWLLIPVIVGAIVAALL
jgi:hypothetical protein